MTKQKMTIHRGLAELKLIDSRIDKSIGVVVPIGLMQKGKLVNGITEKEEFEKNATSKFQSINDLIDRKNDIKSAIVISNGITKVKIGDKEMTVADAINFKTVIEFKKKLIQHLSSQHRSAMATFTKENDKLKDTAMKNALIILGKEGENNVKATDDDVKAIVEPFIERNELQFVDPLKVENLVEDLSKEVDEFEIEVDAVLSETNAITFIEV